MCVPRGVRVSVLGGLIASAVVLSLSLSTRAQSSHEPAPGKDYPVVGEDAAWTWFGGPRAVSYDGEFHRTYTGWISSKGEIKIASIDRDTGAVEVSTLWVEQDADDHSNPSILVRPDGRLMVFCSPHCWRAVRNAQGGRVGGIYYRVSERPEDISSWGPPQVMDQNVPGSYGWTYPKPVQLSAENDRIYLFWRGGTGSPILAISDDGAEWVLGGILIDTGEKRPYMVIASNDEDEIHIAYTRAHPDESSENGIYYLKYRDGAFVRADGSKIKDIWELPAGPSECDLVYDGSSSGKSWVWDIAFDENGDPVIVYAVFPTEDDHRYEYARWRDGEWKTTELVEGGPAFPRRGNGVSREQYYSGGIALDHSNPDVVFLSRLVDGVYEIERWETTDRGDTWTSLAVTSGSTFDNVRPVVPLHRSPGDPLVLWMSGVYYRYDIFGTGIRHMPDGVSGVGE